MIKAAVALGQPTTMVSIVCTTMQLEDSFESTAVNGTAFFPSLATDDLSCH